MRRSDGQKKRKPIPNPLLFPNTKARGIRRPIKCGFKLKNWEKLVGDATNRLMELGNELELEAGFTLREKDSLRYSGGGIAVLSVMPTGDVHLHENGEPVMKTQVTFYGNKENLLKGVELLVEELKRAKAGEGDRIMRVGVKPRNGALVFVDLIGSRFADIRRWAEQNGAKGNFTHGHKPLTGLIAATWPKWGTLWASDTGSLSDKQVEIVKDYYVVGRGKEEQK